MSGEAVVERHVSVDGVELWSRRSGNGPAALLLAGAAMPSRIWQLGLEPALLSAGYSVISFDWRDTGRSTWRRFRDHPYDFDQLVDDANEVAVAWGVERCAVIGYSMGGCAAQLLALRQPQLVTSLGLVSSGFASVISVPDTPRRQELFAALASQDDSSSETLASSLLRQWNILHGHNVRFDADRWADIIDDWLEWGHNSRCPHIKLGPDVFGRDRTSELATITAPTLIVHGDDDPMFPIDHAHALASTLPDATLTEVADAGHELFASPEVHRDLVSHLAETTGAET